MYKDRFLLLGILLFFVALTTSTFAQSAETRRLYVAVDGFELNEAAANDALKSGADINWKNDAMKGETMLIMAIKGFKEAKIIKFLLDNGADASIKDDSGKTALEWARQYNIGRDRNGKEILAMVESAAGQTEKPNETNSTDEPKTKNTPKTITKTNPAKVLTKRKGDKPTVEEIKTMLEAKFTSIYEDHYCCKEKNKVEFEWLAPIQIGGQITRGSIPGSCWDTKIDVKVTFTKQSSGETGSVRRGINGKPVKEGFCIWINAYDEWDYLTYAP